MHDNVNKFENFQESLSENCERRFNNLQSMVTPCNNISAIYGKIANDNPIYRENLGKDDFNTQAQGLAEAADIPPNRQADFLADLARLCDHYKSAANAAVKSAVPGEPEALSSAAPLALPERAPEIYAGNRGGKKSGENIIEFLRRVYGAYIEASLLTRPDLKRLDSKAYKALNNWLASNGELPADIHIPKKSEANDAEIERLGGAQVVASSSLFMAARRRINNKV